MASPIASTVSIATLILGKPNKWHDWLFLVKRKALQLAVDEFIDPDFAIEPPLPIKPVRLSPDHVKANAASIYALNAEQRGIYR